MPEEGARRRAAHVIPELGVGVVAVDVVAVECGLEVVGGVGE